MHTITVAQLCAAFGFSVASCNGGCYPGTTIPMREITADMTLIVLPRVDGRVRVDAEPMLIDRLFGGPGDAWLRERDLARLRAIGALPRV